MFVCVCVVVVKDNDLCVGAHVCFAHRGRGVKERRKNPKQGPQC